jgi:eukaryotic-like serine/threonine-protein kinase
MSFTKYLFSKVFVAQLLLAIGIIAALVYGFFHWITYITHHGNEITVPNLLKLSEDQVDDKLSDLDLTYQVIDTMEYDPKIPKLAVVFQEPLAGEKVKEGRKIYLKINATGYKMVAIPNIIDKTFRQAIPTLKSVGLLVGDTTRVPYLGKDMVLDMKINGKPIKPGTKVLRATKIDLVLGDGKVVFDESKIDSLTRELPELTEEEKNSKKIIDSIKD